MVTSLGAQQKPIRLALHVQTKAGQEFFLFLEIGHNQRKVVNGMDTQGRLGKVDPAHVYSSLWSPFEKHGSGCFAPNP